MKNFESRPKRIIATTLAYGYEPTVTGVYAPMDDTSAQCKQEFYDELTVTIDRVLLHKEIIIAGDLNARVESRIEEYGE